MTPQQIFADNPVCRLLGIRYPICQAGMYQVAYGRLAAAVSNAGGLGCIGSAYMDPARLREEIRIAKQETDQPFGVDILFARIATAAKTDGSHQLILVKAQVGFAHARSLGTWTDLHRAVPCPPQSLRRESSLMAAR